MEDSFERALRQMEEEREQRRIEFFNKVGEIQISNEDKYDLLALKLCRRYGIDCSYTVPDVVYGIINYYVENDVQEDFMEWINKNDSPLVRRLSSVKKIFPEFKDITDDERKIVKLANQVYGLELDVCECFGGEYVYAYEFDFNKFTPIDINRIKELKVELKFCKKYNGDPTKLEEELNSFGLTEEQLEVI